MNVTVLLADYAEVSDRGKLTAVGLGWTKTSSPIAVHSVILIIQADESELGIVQSIDLRLVDSTGTDVADSNGEPIRLKIEVQINAERGAEVPGLTNIAITLGAGLSLEPGIYSWEARSSNHPGMVWARPFHVAQRNYSDVESVSGTDLASIDQ